jgi:hypothetical protein
LVGVIPFFLVILALIDKGVLSCFDSIGIKSISVKFVLWESKYDAVTFAFEKQNNQDFDFVFLNI